MEKLEILTKLTRLVQSGLSKAVIERDAGLPKNSLSSVLTGVKEMPNKWVEKFGGYFEKLEVKTVGNTLLTTEPITQVEKKYPIGGYAPGNYQCRCFFCGEPYQGDKRSVQCEPCAVKDLKKAKWISEIEEFCEKKGFPPSELIEKYEGLETELAKPLSERNKGQWREFLTDGQNKPQISPETGLPANPSKNQHKAKSGAESKPAELSPFLKSRQNLKNGIK